jgi:CDP-paratose 2-epimerase
VGGSLDVSFSLRELTTICQEITGNSISINSTLENRPADLRIYLGDNEKITQRCGWAPKRSVKNIVEDSFQWLRDNERIVKTIFE